VCVCVRVCVCICVRVCVCICVRVCVCCRTQLVLQLLHYHTTGIYTITQFIVSFLQYTDRYLLSLVHKLNYDISRLVPPIHIQTVH
jgi:hypothetical protein